MSSKRESDVCCRLQVAPSGESYKGKRRPGRKQWQTTAGSMARFTSRHLRADCLYTGMSSGPTLGNEYWKTLPFYFYLDVFYTYVAWCFDCDAGGRVRSGSEATRPVAAPHGQQQGRAGVPGRRELERRRRELRQRAQVRQKAARRLHRRHLHDPRRRRHLLVAQQARNAPVYT